MVAVDSVQLLASILGHLIFIRRYSGQGVCPVRSSSSLGLFLPCPHFCRGCVEAVRWK